MAKFYKTSKGCACLYVESVTKNKMNNIYELKQNILNIYSFYNLNFRLLKTNNIAFIVACHKWGMTKCDKTSITIFHLQN